MRKSPSVDGALQDPSLSHSDEIFGDFVAATPIHQTDPVTSPNQYSMKSLILKCVKVTVSLFVRVCVHVFSYL